VAARGYRTAVHYGHAREEADAVVAEIEAAGGIAMAFAADLTIADSPAALVNAVTDAFGRLDLLVNSAASMQRTPIGEVTPAAWDAIMALNLRAPFFAAQAAATRMTTGGVIVNLADLGAFETWPGYVPHGISKAGVVQMTRALARVLAPRIRVNAIAPGVVLLPEGWAPASADRLAATTPMKRIGSPDDVLRALDYLLDAEFVTGEVLLVDGGRHVRV
jgi:pteridine reductase